MANLSIVSSVLVVFIHAATGFTPQRCSLGWWCLELFPNGICRIAVPFFFFASGYFLARHVDDRRWWRTEVQKRIRTILIPLLAWNLIYFFYYSFILLVSNVISGRAWTAGLTIDLGRLLCYNLMDVPISVPLWFLRSLFIIVVLSPLMAFCLRKSRWSAAVFIIIVATAYMLISPWRVPNGWRSFFRFGISLEGVFYFSIGMLICLRVGRTWVEESSFGFFMPFCCMILGLAGFALRAISDGAPWQGICHIFGILFVLMAVVSIVPGTNWKSVAVRNAFPVYLIHCAVLFPISIILNRINEEFVHASIGLFVIKGLLAIVVSIGIANSLRKMSPRLANLLLGGR